MGKLYLTVHVSTRMCIKLPGRDGCHIRDLSEGAGGGGGQRGAGGNYT